MHKASRWLAIAPLLLALACKHGSYGDHDGHGDPPVNLEPNDPRPVYSIEVGDEIEAALLEQQLGLVPLRLTGKTLYFYDTADIRKKLDDYGYVATQADLYTVYERVVRVARRGDEQELKRFSVRLINREPDAWIVRGQIGTLRALAAAGYSLSAIASNEPKPRVIRVWAKTPEEVQQISRYVSIYATSGQFVPKDNQRLIGVAATAFDDGIDALTALGFTVERLEDPPQDGGVRQ